MKRGIKDDVVLFSLFTQISYTVKTYTTTAREPSIYTIEGVKTTLKKFTTLPKLIKS